MERWGHAKTSPKGKIFVNKKYLKIEKNKVLY